MTTEGIKRKLTAILSADAVGYSRLMAADEVDTIQRLKSFRELIGIRVREHHGRVVDSPGDNILAEFPSALDAVRSVVEIQRVLKTRNDDLPDNRKMKFRIGIHLGDVMVDGDRIYGDGVNIAARLEGLADPGGICISSIVHNQVKNKLDLSYEDIGDQDVKNIPDPIQAYKILSTSNTVAILNGKSEGISEKKYRKLFPILGILILLCIGFILVRYDILGTKIPSEPASVSKTTSIPVEKPSIAVLPFDNLSGDPGQEYFVDGMTEEIISRLSKNSMLTVIARNSTFTYKGKPIKVQQVAQDLGVQHVLEGSVRKAVDKVRITAQLIDAISGGHLWSETYEREMKDIFAVQAEIAQRIAAALRVQYTEAELARVKRIPTNNLTAYDSFWRGYDHFHRFTREDIVQARKYFQRAVELDSDYADAFALLAHTHSIEYSLNWELDPQVLEQAFDLSEKALSLDKSSIYAHAVQSDIYRTRNQNELAFSKAEKVISLDPNNSWGYNMMGLALQFMGRSREAIEIMKIAVALDPNSALYRWNLGDIYLQAGQYKKANAAYQECWARNSDFAEVYLSLASSYLYQWETQRDDDPKSLDMAFEMANKYVTMTEREAAGNAALGRVYLFRKQHDLAIAEAKKIFDRAPQSLGGYAFLAEVYNFMGRSDEAFELAEKAIRLHSQKPSEYTKTSTIAELGIAYRLNERQEEAIATLRKTFNHVPIHEDSFRAHLNLTILYAESNQIEKARSEATEILKLSPDFNVDVWGIRIPYKNPSQTERDMAALRKAGLK